MSTINKLVIEEEQAPCSLCCHSICKINSISKDDHFYKITDIRRSVIGGGRRDRTDDNLLAKQALSQLSYTPKRLT